VLPSFKNAPPGIFNGWLFDVAAANWTKIGLIGARLGFYRPLSFLILANQLRKSGKMEYVLDHVREYRSRALLLKVALYCSKLLMSRTQSSSFPGPAPSL
jgi:hypothetical protein